MQGQGRSYPIHCLWGITLSGNRDTYVFRRSSSLNPWLRSWWKEVQYDWLWNADCDTHDWRISSFNHRSLFKYKEISRPRPKSAAYFIIHNWGQPPIGQCLIYEFIISATFWAVNSVLGTETGLKPHKTGQKLWLSNYQITLSREFVSAIFR